jgi:hypothetical protein
MDIFVSYTLRDRVLSPVSLKALEVSLWEIGRPYIDILHNRSMFPQSHVERKLSDSDLMLACITEEFFYSPWVVYELSIAAMRRMPIVVLDLRSFRSLRVKADWLPPWGLRSTGSCTPYQNSSSA